MASSSRISVIIPHFNRVDLLAATLESILAQSLPAYEIIVVDDQSTEDLSGVIARYRDRVIFLENQGQGACEARNTGFHASTGDFIQFFDSDDLMTYNKLESQADVLQTTGAAMVHGPYVKAAELPDGTWKQLDAVIHHGPILFNLRLDKCVLRGWSTLTQSCLFRREIFAECGLWRSGLGQYDDIEFLFRIGKVIGRQHHENKSCVIYRQHGLQLTDGNFDQTTSSQYNREVIQILHKASRASDYNCWDRMAADCQYYHSTQFAKKSGFISQIPDEVDNWHIRLLWFNMRLRVKLRIKFNGLAWHKPMLNYNTSPQVFEHYLRLLRNSSPNDGECI